MAYATKYRIDFFDNKGVEWRIDIDLDGWGGGVTELNAESNFATLRWSGGDDTFTLICPSELSIAFYSETDYQFREFFDAAWGDYRAVIIKDPNGSPSTKWTGYNVHDMYSEPFTMAPYPINLKFVDGLARLKNIPWDNSGVLYAGLKHDIEIVRLCLNKLPTALNIVEACNLYDDDMASTTSDSAMVQTYTLAERFREIDRQNGEDDEEIAMSCWDVLECILSSPWVARLFIKDNKWHIVRVEEMTASTLDAREFVPSVGSESATAVLSASSISIRKTIDNAGTIHWLEQDANLEILSAVEKIVLTYKSQTLQHQNNDLLKNGDFWDWLDSSPKQPLFWSPVGINTALYDPKIIGIHGGNPPPYNGTYSPSGPNPHLFLWHPDDIETLTSHDNTKYLESTSTNHVLSTTDKFRLTCMLRQNVMTPGSSWLSSYFTLLCSAFRGFLRMRVKFTILGGGTDYYLKGDVDINGDWKSGSPTWETTESFVTFERFWQWSDYGVVGNFCRIQREVETGAFPASGVFDLNFRVYAPWTSYNIPGTINPSISTTEGVHLDIQYAYIGRFHLTYLDNGSDIPVELQLVEELDPDADIFEWEVCRGDGPGGISLGALRLSTGELCDVWARRGVAESLTALDQVIRTIARLRGAVRKRIDGTLNGNYDDVNFINVLVSSVDTGAGVITDYLAPLEIDWDIQAAQVQFKGFEIKSETGLSFGGVAVGHDTPLLGGGGGSPEPLFAGDSASATATGIVIGGVAKGRKFTKGYPSTFPS